MTRFNTTRIANRIGRITIATTLAGVLGALVYLFVETIRNPIPPSSFFDFAIEFSFMWGIGVFFAALVTTPILLAKWGLPRRVSSVRFWQAALAMAVLGSAALAWLDTGSVSFAPWRFALATVTYLSYALAVLAGVALVEWVASSGLADHLTGTDAMTGVGLAAIVVAVLIATVVGGGAVAGVLMDSSNAGSEPVQTEEAVTTAPTLADVDRSDPTAYDTNSAPIINSATPLEGESDAVTVGCSGSIERPDPYETFRDYSPAEVHTNAEIVQVSNVEVETENGTVVPKAHYHVTFEGVNTSDERVVMERTYAENRTGDRYASVWTGAASPTDTGLFLEMPRVESTHFYVDLVTDDGELHRYITEVCRDDV